MHQFEYVDFEARRDRPEVTACWLATQQMLAAVNDTLDGYCDTCGDLRTFNVVRNGNGEVETREGLVCGACGFSARIRATIAMLRARAPDARDIYITEQSTAVFAYLQKQHPGIRGSEFEPDASKRESLGAWLAQIGGHGPVEFQDITRLTFEDASQDAIVSMDVLEHVPDYAAALREFARVLRPGGVVVATFPFIDVADTLVRASIGDDGTITHHETPEYHGDPIGGPVLCFQHFGWDVLSLARASGFSDAAMVMPWAPERAFYYGHWTLVATR
ncbi:hypothetical protein LYSHEL_08750 [Lysobacter helvus]|uniref:Methyltransferase type 11 domain-containing protein n=2 Tax=Lysobacteraceae TaxID=32033 RepID=A0ABM7Q3I3_9GAMM|nr:MULTISPECIES: class I SAM-dependent methyltransferase [Lysobacter]BCT91851.1 hypothetical protein LYSCAS_08750 [Lysobacter caseinilyticus]BCT95004.1 hypothetical protein LYSHEL_08750 [Lysobacter helvus]